MRKQFAKQDIWYPIVRVFLENKETLWYTVVRLLTCPRGTEVCRLLEFSTMLGESGKPKSSGRGGKHSITHVHWLTREQSSVKTAEQTSNKVMY